MTKHIPLEKTITNNILKYLNALPRCRARKMPSGPYGSGWPDILCVYQGMALFIEVKRPKLGKLTELQKRELVNWAGAGAHTVVATSVEEAKEFIKWLYERGFAS